MKILYLEDDISLSDTITEFLEDEGFDVCSVYDGNKALDTLYKSNFDILILDVQVPKINGFELLKYLREANINTPTIFTTSLNSIDDLSRGYDLGADDYLRKPFALKELLFRVKALLKREYKISENSIDIDENIKYNTNIQELNNNGDIYTLNQKEHNLLMLLLKHKNSCVSFEEIFESVWSFSQTHSPQSLRTYIKNLRKYLGKEKIQSVKKQGYMLNS